MEQLIYCNIKLAVLALTITRW